MGERRGTRLNFGQSSGYKIYMGSDPVSLNAPTNGTRLSAGTMQITTGLATVSTFVCTFQSSAASAGGRHGYPHHIHWMRGYKNNGGVTVVLTSQYASLAAAGCTPAGVAKLGGCTLNWMAAGDPIGG